MNSWLNNPAIITAIASAIGGLVAIGIWIGRVNSDRDSFKKFMNRVQQNMDRIRQDIKEILGRLPPAAVAGSSPLELTDLGKTISEKLNGKDCGQRELRQH